MAPKTTRTVVTSPNTAPETLRPSQLTIVPDAPTVDATITPEHVLSQVEIELTKAGGLWAKGAKAFALKTAGQRIHNALAEVRAAEEHAAALRANMTALIKEGLDAINGVMPPSKAKAPKAG
jgi:hypothetical protein